MSKDSLANIKSVEGNIIKGFLAFSGVCLLAGVALNVVIISLVTRDRN